MFFLIALWNFTPVLILVLIPNRLNWLLITLAFLCLSYYPVLKQPPEGIIFFTWMIMPALIMKIFAIWVRSKEKIGFARALSSLGLIGPIIATSLFYFDLQLPHAITKLFN